MFMIKEIPKPERPRERFVSYGAKALSNTELLAIILRTGYKSESVIELSKTVLFSYPSLKELSRSTISDLTSIKGIGKTKAIELLACFELGRRIQDEPFIKNVFLRSPEDIYKYMKGSLELETQEHFVALYLNTKGELISRDTLFKGTLSSSVIHPREIFKYAVLYSAASIVMIHNHPSGDPTPSHNDIEITKRIHQSSVMMDIILLDHVIIGQNKYYSFKEHQII